MQQDGPLPVLFVLCLPMQLKHVRKKPSQLLRTRVKRNRSCVNDIWMQMPLSQVRSIGPLGKIAIVIRCPGGF